jgi:hypothetical protein
MRNYMTMPQVFTEKAKLHEQRAIEWVAKGKSDYAEGSLRKAAKWRKRAGAFEIDPILGTLFFLEKIIADNVLRGRVDG